MKEIYILAFSIMVFLIGLGVYNQTIEKSIFLVCVLSFLLIIGFLYAIAAKKFNQKYSK